MTGTYFDFSNTPITSNITLKAKWCGCGGGPEDDIIASFYQGQGARVTLTTGEVKYVPISEYASFSDGKIVSCYSTPDFTGERETVDPIWFKSIEFGKGEATLLAPRALAGDFHYRNLSLVTGKLDHVPESFLSSGAALPTMNVMLEVTANTIGQGFMSSQFRASGTIIFNCPESAFTNISTPVYSSQSMLNCPIFCSDTPLTTSGFAIGGTAADYVLATYASISGFRKLYKLT